MASFLPKVKCSDCGQEIEISLMGEHICNTYSQVTPPPDPDYGPNRFDQQLQPSSNDRNLTGFLKPGRPGPPPRIDPNLANRPFLRPNELTPASSGNGSQALTPVTPSLDPKQSYRSPSRSMTSPLPQALGSPDLTTNLDCAFPPFPTSASRSGTPVPDQRGLMSVFDDGVNGKQGPSDSRSPRRNQTVSGTAARNRGNTLARNADPIPRPSTAGSNRRPSVTSNYGGFARDDDPAPPVPAMPAWNSPSPSGPGKLDGGYGGMGNDTSPYAPLNPYAQMNSYSQMNPYALSPGDNFAASPVDDGNVAAPWPESNRGPQNPPPNRPLPPLVGLQNDQNNAISRPQPSPTRSQTFPLRNDQKTTNNGPNRRPSEPSSRMRAPLPSSMNPPPIIEPTTVDDFRPYKPMPAMAALGSRQYPPRGNSKPTLQLGGMNDMRNFMGRGEQPPLSPGYKFAEDLDIGNPYHTPSDSASSQVSDVSSAATMSSQSSVSRSPPRRIETKNHIKQTSLEAPTFSANQPVTVDSPTDPLFQQGRLSPIPRVTPTPPPQPSSNPRLASPGSIRRPPTRNGTSKGTCRGCSRLIMAGEKSVSSADGRLTGRYHKACFVCHACRSPFATADFYVIDNAPYCAQHYHEANGSLCNSCGSGIEGQYLEADTEDSSSKSGKPAAKKFHPECFTCGTCKLMLNDDFFVFGGKIYCERDAFVAAGAGPQNKNNSNTNGHSRNKSSASRTAAVNRANGLLAPGMGLPATGGTGGGRKFPERRTTRMMMI